MVLLALTFAMLGLLLGLAGSSNVQKGEGSTVVDSDPEIQSKLFKDCTMDAKSDGELTEEEYFRCAYGIYG